MRSGGLFAGYGGLEMAISEVFGAEPAWFSEIEPGPSKILAHHWPTVPNRGDITKIDWDQVESVDVLGGGFPCQDVSLAGKRAGLTPDSRSGLWNHFAYAISKLRPRYVVVENVRGLLSAEAHSDVEPCPWCLGEGSGEPDLRALGAVLGDLAELGYDAQWCGLRAADIGAPHGRYRVFILAEHTAIQGLQGQAGGWLQPSMPGSGCGGLATDPGSNGRQWRTEPDRGAAGGIDASLGHDADRCADPAANTSGERHGDARPAGIARVPAAAVGGSTDHQGGLNAYATEDRSGEDVRELREGVHPAPVRESTRGQVPLPLATPLLAGMREHEASGEQGREPLASPQVQGSSMRGVLGDHATSRSSQGPEPSEQRPGEPSDTVRLLPPEAALAGRPGEPTCGCAAWGQYAAAIHRWERILGRLAPEPTQVGPKGSRRLSPLAVEFMMGLPAGHVTDVPGVNRNAQLKALGNGVVPQQASAALRHMYAALRLREAV